MFMICSAVFAIPPPVHHHHHHHHHYKDHNPNHHDWFPHRVSRQPRDTDTSLSNHHHKIHLYTLHQFFSQGEPDLQSQICAQVEVDGQTTSSMDPSSHTYHGQDDHQSSQSIIKVTIYKDFSCHTYNGQCPDKPSSSKFTIYKGNLPFYVEHI